MQKININKLFLGVAMLCLFSSCKDWLTIEPQNKIVKENFWKTKEDVELVMGSTYNKMRNTVDEEFLWGEIRGDFFVQSDKITEKFKKVMEGNIYPDNNYLVWNDYYKVINQANLIMDNAPEVRKIDLKFTQEELDEIMGQMMFLRSYCFFKLALSFRDIPMPLIAYEYDSQDFQIEATPQREVFMKIIEDMDVAEDLLPEEFMFENSNDLFKGKATKYAAIALKANVYLWLGEPQKAIDECDKIIDSKKFALLSINKWFEIFRDGFTNESIFEIYANGNDGQSNPSNIRKLSSNSENSKSNRYFAVAPDKYQLFNGDPRGELRTVALSIGEADRTLWKWLGNSELTPRDYRDKDDANWIVFRLAEIYLIKAEAAIDLGEFATARDAINEVRSRAGVSLLTLGEEADKGFWYNVLLEDRLLELAGEGKRWHDLVRIASKENYAYDYLLIDKIMSNIDISLQVLMKSKIRNHDFWYLPIHEDELRVNKKLVQNDFYKTN